MLESNKDESIGYSLEVRKFDADEYDLIITPEGQPLITVMSLAKRFEVPLKQANRIITLNHDIFVDRLVKIKTGVVKSLGAVIAPDFRLKSIDCLTLAGATTWLSELDRERYDDERKDYLVRLIRWLHDLGEAEIIGGPRPVFDKVRERADSKIYHKEHMQAIAVNYQKRKGTILTARYPFIRGSVFANKKAFGFHEKGMREHATGAGLNRLNAIINRDIPLLYLGMSEPERSHLLDEIDSHFEKPDVPLLEESAYQLSDGVRKVHKDQVGLNDFTNN